MARPVGVITRGTTAPNRLRRVDRWFLRTYGTWLRRRTDPLVVDLGYGANATTTFEMFTRLREARIDAEVLGLEIDPERVTAGKSLERDGLHFALGGFELPAPRRPDVVRAFNVLRQYDESDVVATWDLIASRMASDAVIVEGTCNEIGRVATWVTLREQSGHAVPQTLTLAARLGSLDRPATFAERLPKALIHRNVPGEPIHRYLDDLDHAWQVAAGVGSLSARQRWVSACESMKVAGWPIRDGRSAWRDGELTVEWSAVAPLR